MSNLSEIAAGLDRGEFEAVFQPIVRLPTRDVLGFEALARWRRGGELLSPGAFLEGLKDPELEARISEAVALKAIDAAQALTSLSLDFGSIAVNFGERQISDDEYAKRLIARLRDHGLAASKLSVEVRETVKLSPETAAEATALQRLASEGVTVAIDDFGVGYANVQCLLPSFVGRVKVDLSLTRSAMVSSRARKVLRLSVMMAEELGIEAVVEGVESAEIEAMLLELGCEAAQGFFYARPEPLSVVVAQLRQGGYARPGGASGESSGAAGRG